MDKITKLSQAIRYGATFLGEYWPTYWNGDRTCGCAIGTAWLAVNNGEGTAMPVCNAVALRFDVPLNVVMHVSAKHHQGEMNREQCAAYLEKLGY